MAVLEEKIQLLVNGSLNNDNPNDVAANYRYSISRRCAPVLLYPRPWATFSREVDQSRADDLVLGANEGNGRSMEETYRKQGTFPLHPLLNCGIISTSCQDSHAKFSSECMKNGNCQK